MQYKANVSFAGIVTAHKGEIITITDEQVINDLLACGYISIIKPAKSKTRKKVTLDGYKTE